MNTLPQIESITRFQKNHTNVLSLLDKGPVILTQHSKPAAVMIAPNEWDAIARELSRFRVIAEARRIEARNDANDSWVSDDELLGQLAERGVHVEA